LRRNDNFVRKKGERCSCSGRDFLDKAFGIDNIHKRTEEAIMKHKIFLVIALCLLMVRFSTAQERAFEEKVELIATYGEDQEVIDPNVFPQLAAQDKVRLALLASYIMTIKNGNYKLANCFKISEIDSFFFQSQIYSMIKTKAKIHFICAGPGSGIHWFITDQYNFKANSHYSISLGMDPNFNWSKGTYKVTVMVELLQTGSAVGCGQEMTFRLF